MKYAIKNTSGQWWTGECWGVEQAREEYHPDAGSGQLTTLPIWLPEDNSNEEILDLWAKGDPADWLYYPNDDGRYDVSAVASVVAL